MSEVLELFGSLFYVSLILRKTFFRNILMNAYGIAVFWKWKFIASHKLYFIDMYTSLCSFSVQAQRDDIICGTLFFSVQATSFAYSNLCVGSFTNLWKYGSSLVTHPQKLKSEPCSR